MEVPTPPPTEPHSFIQWGAVIIIGAMGTVVAFLFKLRENENSQKIKGLTESFAKCEEEHQKASEKILGLTEELSYIKGRMDHIEQKIQ